MNQRLHVVKMDVKDVVREYRGVEEGGASSNPPAFVCVKNQTRTPMMPPPTSSKHSVKAAHVYKHKFGHARMLTSDESCYVGTVTHCLCKW